VLAARKDIPMSTWQLVHGAHRLDQEVVTVKIKHIHG